MFQKFDVPVNREQLIFCMDSMCMCWFSAQHKDMVRTFWRTNRIRKPKSSPSVSTDTVHKVFSDAQKVSYTIMQDYQNDIKKRFRSSDAAKWKDWLECQKTVSRKATLKSFVDDDVSSVDSEESLQLQTSKVPSLTASSVSTLEWRMEAFILPSEDYQRYSLFVLVTVICLTGHFYCFLLSRVLSCMCLRIYSESS